MAQVIAALCRHGIYEQPENTPSAHLLHPLTDEGRSQAGALAGELQEICDKNGWKLDPVIDTSTLQRAYQTAELCAAALAKDRPGTYSVEQFDDLSERCLGAAANLTLAEIEHILDQDTRFDRPPVGWKAMSEYRLPFPGAESLLEAGFRCAEHMRTRTRTLRTRAEGAVLKVFVGHGAAFRHAAVAVGAMSLETVSAVSMYYGRPVCLVTSDNAPWKHVAGHWKPRKGEQRPD